MALSSEAVRGSNHGLLKACKECGETFSARRIEAAFCCNACKGTYNNRRANRGAALYDLVMEMRYDRPAAKERESFTQLCALAAQFHDEDKAQGKRSWSSSVRMKATNSRLAGIR